MADQRVAATATAAAEAAAWWRGELGCWQQSSSPKVMFLGAARAEADRGKKSGRNGDGGGHKAEMKWTLLHAGVSSVGYNLE